MRIEMKSSLLSRSQIKPLSSTAWKFVQIGQVSVSEKKDGKKSKGITEEGKLVPIPGVDDHVADRKAPGPVVIGMVYIEQIK